MKKIIFFPMLALFFILNISSAAAIGQMTAPIIIENAMRGEDVHQAITAVNTDPRPAVIQFSAGGQIEKWTKFYLVSDLKNPISTSTVASSSNFTVTAVFSVPADAANGEYSGAISVTKLADELEAKNESQTSIAQKIDREVVIKVSDQEKISLQISVIPKKYNLLPGEPMEIRIIYDNQSNVQLKPAINIKLQNAEKIWQNVIYPYPDGVEAVKSLGRQEIPALSIQTLGLPNGRFAANLIFTRGEETLAEKEFSFSIGPSSLVGTLSVSNWFAGKLNWILASTAFILLMAAIVLFRKNLFLRRTDEKE